MTGNKFFLREIEEAKTEFLIRIEPWIEKRAKISSLGFKGYVFDKNKNFFTEFYTDEANEIIKEIDKIIEFEEKRMLSKLNKIKRNSFL